MSYSNFTADMFDMNRETPSANSLLSHMFDAPTPDKNSEEPDKNGSKRLKLCRVPTEEYAIPVSEVASNVRLRSTSEGRSRPIGSQPRRHVRRVLADFCNNHNPFARASDTASTGGALVLERPPTKRLRSLFQRATGAEVVEGNRLVGGMTNPGQANLLECATTGDDTCIVRGVAASNDHYAVYECDESRPFGRRDTLVEPVRCCDPRTFREESRDGPDGCRVRSRCLNRDLMDVRAEVMDLSGNPSSVQTSVRKGEDGGPEFVFTGVQNARATAVSLAARASYEPPESDTLDVYVGKRGGEFSRDVGLQAGETLSHKSCKRENFRRILNVVVICLACVAIAVSIYFVVRLVMRSVNKPSAPPAPIRAIAVVPPSALPDQPAPSVLPAAPPMTAVIDQQFKAEPTSTGTPGPRGTGLPPQRTTDSLVMSLRQRIEDLLR